MEKESKRQLKIAFKITYSLNPKIIPEVKQLVRDI